MTSIADALLAAGCAPLIAAAHGETVTMLSGVDAGVSYIAVIEIEQDLAFNGDLGEDRRGKRIIRFAPASCPTGTAHSLLQDASGHRWKIVRLPVAAFLSTDFELVEVTARDS